MRNDPYDPMRPCCLSCPNSFSLPADEPFDDDSVEGHDRLICMLKRRPVDEKGCCNEHPDNLEEEAK